ncbi:MAG TPA: FGGY-family carbohydrate kinase [Pseudogracilibacillus sp.]|nr:FGGY-family carbohydrate kinase [Pseudogracilibacillus sp.]
MKHKSLDLSKTALGIELGSTRIKAVLIDEFHSPVAHGEFEWENRFENGVWTYPLEDVWTGIQAAYQQISQEIATKFEIPLTTVGSIGFSAMMHGYLPFDSKGNLLTPFRTWRNTNTKMAAERLTELFQFNIPLRWSVAHVYQAILDNEAHIHDIDFITTLAGYVHWKLTEHKVIGIGDAAGMFPIEKHTNNYNQEMLQSFQELVDSQNVSITLEDCLPKVLLAGDQAGSLTEEGAKMLDPSGTLQPGVPLCPPEGDAGTGMVATNTVKEHSGNISAGTSIFSMIVLDRDLHNYYKEIDIVTTPDGKPVAMVHCNNFTSDINEWTNVFKEFAEAIGVELSQQALFTTLFQEALKAESNVGDIVHCNYYSGEPITGLDQGRPLFARMPDSNFNLANFMRSQIYSAIATLEIGMEILTQKEKVQIEFLLGHGGFFKTEKIGQQMMADALKIPTSVMKTAGEGGPWGMSLLAAYMNHKSNDQMLASYLEQNVFNQESLTTTNPEKEGMQSFEAYLKRYKKMLNVEKAAVQYLN